MIFLRYLCIAAILSFCPVASQAEIILKFSAIKGSLHTPISKLVLQEAYERLDIGFVIREYPAARAILMANTGVVVDGELHRQGSAAENYTNLIKIPIALATIESVAVTKKLLFDVKGLESLASYKIGVVRGLKSERLLSEMKVENFIVVSSYQQLLIMLEKERVEVIIMTRLAALKNIVELNLRGMNILEPPLAEATPIYHFLHKKNEHLVGKLTRVLTTMEKSGRIEQIQRQYEKNFYRSNK